jgi:ABC-type Fe3+-hydroxamate transport system substrate-binding protein
MNSGVLFALKKSLGVQLESLSQSFAGSPKKIVSLVPSLTELLHYLGLEEAVTGVTKFCIHPNKWYRSKTRVGGTKTPDIELIFSLQPDLIIANKEENRKEDIEALAKQFPVYLGDTANLEDALEEILFIGKLTGATNRAEVLADAIEKEFVLLKPCSLTVNTAYLIWQNPLMASGDGTFINDMMQRCGLKNIFSGIGRYPETTTEALRSLNCELVLLSSEPFPFNEEHAVKLRAELPGTKVLLVDGEMFSWYGSRLLEAPGYFKTLMTHF